MPIILTAEYAENTFFIPYTSDKEEGVLVKPLSKTIRREIRDQAIQQAGHDQAITEDFIFRTMLEMSIKDWKGFFDVKGQEIPYTKETLKACMAVDPDFFTSLYTRILHVARFGALQDEKN